MSEFNKNDSHCWSNFLQTNIFGNFDRICRIYNQTNYKDIWFAKVITILLWRHMRLFSMFLSKKTCTLMPLSLQIIFKMERKTWKSTLKFLIALLIVAMNRSNPPEGFLGKDILKIWSKFTGEHPCRSVISIKLLCNFIEITFPHGCSPVNLLHIYWNTFSWEHLWRAATEWIHLSIN